IFARPNRRRQECSDPILLQRLSQTNTVWQVVWSAAALPFSLSSPKKEERAVFRQFPLSPALSPLVPRGERGKNALRVFQAEHNWSETRRCNSKFETRTRPAGNSAGVVLSFPATLAWSI